MAVIKIKEKKRPGYLWARIRNILLRVNIRSKVVIFIKRKPPKDTIVIPFWYFYIRPGLFIVKMITIFWLRYIYLVGRNLHCRIDLKQDHAIFDSVYEIKDKEYERLSVINVNYVDEQNDSPAKYIHKRASIFQKIKAVLNSFTKVNFAVDSLKYV